MSSFKCPECGTDFIDSPNGYILRVTIIKCCELGNE